MAQRHQLQSDEQECAAVRDSQLLVGPSGQPRPDEGKAQRAYQRAGQSAAVLAVPSQSESSGAQTLGRN